MKLNILKGLFYILLLLPSVLATSCSSDEPEEPAEKERLILIYAIAANNLQYNLHYDMEEIISAGKKLNLRNNTVLIYSVDRTGECKLQELRKYKNQDKYYFETVKIYPTLPLSTSPERIKTVIEDVALNYDYPNKGLVLWSHADGWIPWFGGDTPLEEKRRSFGIDEFEDKTYKTNITDLSEAIPAGMFDFIWFDCCYMANIETIYQLRTKTPYIIGSVLEIAADGMPYNLTMPYLLQKESDLQNAAFEFYKYYDLDYTPVSVSIIDTSYLNSLAEATKEILKNGESPTLLSGIQTYQRNLNVKFYDMGQLLNSYTGLDEEIRKEFDTAMNNAVVYKLISDYDFNRRPINVKEYSGLSIHYFVNNGDSYNNYYKELDWYQQTR